MSEFIDIGAPPIAVKIKRSNRARRFSLRISNADGQVSLTVPTRAALRDAVAFARTQEGWMRKHLHKRPAAVVPALGVSIPLDGADHLIVAGQGRSVQVADGELRVPGRPDQVAGKLRGFYKTLARERLATASSHYAAAVGRTYSRITLRDTRSRWGSCTTDGNLMYSWRLVMAPRSVQDYVAAHEVCHLVEMNHSPAYWAQVARIFPNYEAERRWLRKNGAALHQIQL